MTLDLCSMLAPEREALLELLAGLSEDEWEATTECPAWSVHGIALHVLGDDLSLLSRQRDAATHGTALYAEDHPGLAFRGLLDGFNEQWVTAARFLSHPLTIELLRLSGEWTAEFYGSVDLALLGEPVGFFAATGPSPYWQSIAREYIERWVHQQQIRRAVGHPDLGPEFLGPAAAVIARAVAAHLPDVGATVALSIPGLGRWALSGAGDGPADVELTLDAAAATTVLSRGLSADDAAAAFTSSGDAALADRLVRGIAAFAGRPAAG